MADICICEDTGGLHCTVFRIEGSSYLLYRWCYRRRVAECIRRSWILYDPCKNGYMLDKVFACVVVIIALSLLLHGAVVLLEAVLFPYARKKRGKAK